MDFPWVQILPWVFNILLKTLLDPFFWLVLLLIWYLYRRNSQTGRSLYGRRDRSLYSTLVAALFGLAAGGLGSLLIILFGVSIDNIGVGYLWLAALGLMLIHPRFLCFAYGGGLLSLISLLTGHPRLNIPGLMGLVAALHLVESLLILASGHLEPLPVYVRNRAGRVVGGFNLQKFWPIPLAVLSAMIGPLPQTGGVISTPHWWPLIRPLGLAHPDQVIYTIFPVLAALGYGELALTCPPRRKAGRSALHLLLFSLILLGLTVYASQHPQAILLPVLFAPLGHELVIQIGSRGELCGKPYYVPPAEGVMVLEVEPGTPAAAAGLRSGDIICRVGEQLVNSRCELLAALAEQPDSICYRPASGRAEVCKPLNLRGGSGFGVITVPEPGDPPNVGYGDARLWKRLWRRLRNK